jgi:micrococcal nuclease
MLNRTRSPIALLVLILALVVQARADDVIIGKVVRVADGDTITVLENKTQHRIRLFGIDAPERHQAFSNRAKQLAPDQVFGKRVLGVKQDRRFRLTSAPHSSDHSRTVL